MRKVAAAVTLVVLALAGSLAAQQQPGPGGAATDAQIKAAAVELPQLVTLLELKPGMTVADVGAGFGAWTIAFSKWLGPAGRVYASDVGAQQLAALRQAVTRDRERRRNGPPPVSRRRYSSCCSERRPTSPSRFLAQPSYSPQISMSRLQPRAA